MKVVWKLRQKWLVTRNEDTQSLAGSSHLKPGKSLLYPRILDQMPKLDRTVPEIIEHKDADGGFIPQRPHYRQGAQAVSHLLSVMLLAPGGSLTR